MRFSQVDVFTRVPLLGNPLAVVHDADGLDAEQMAAFARWTNLSETTFLCAPTDPDADYRVRIFTTGGELPFAGHPTLGSAHAWLEAGGVPRRAGLIVQQCAAGLVPVHTAGRLAFEAPPLLRSGPVADADLAAVLAALQITRDAVLDAAWIDNGPGWVGVQLASAADVLALTPDPVLCAGLKIGVVGAPDPGDSDAAGRDVEVRAFYADAGGFTEDPVTGSLNAGLAQWLVPAGRLPASYVAGQGRLRGRDGRVHVRVEADGRVLVGGDVVTVVSGEVALGKPGPAGRIVGAAR